MKFFFIFALSLAASSAFADQAVKCACNYELNSLCGEGTPCAGYVSSITFQANRTSFETVGKKVCLEKAQAIVLDRDWTGDVYINDCKFVEKPTACN